MKKKQSEQEFTLQSWDAIRWQNETCLDCPIYLYASIGYNQPIDWAALVSFRFAVLKKVPFAPERLPYKSYSKPCWPLEDECGATFAIHICLSLNLSLYFYFLIFLHLILIVVANDLLSNFVWLTARAIIVANSFFFVGGPLTNQLMQKSNPP